MSGNLKRLFIFVKEIRIMTQEEKDFVRTNAHLMTGVEMAKLLGVTKTTIYNVINELEIIDHELLTIESVLEWMPKMRCSQFARLVKRNPKTVREFCRANDIEEEWNNDKHYEYERELPPKVELDYNSRTPMINIGYDLERYTSRTG